MLMKRVIIIGLSVLFSVSSFAQKPPAYAVASATTYATDAGMDIMKKGGNAFDAAVAVGAMLTVTEPYHTTLGGGGFWLIYDAKRDQYLFIDGRETAPGAATKDMYLDAEGNVIEDAPVTGPLSAGIPGEPAALIYLAEKYGVLPLSETLAPAIKRAKLGFPVDGFYQQYATMR